MVDKNTGRWKSVKGVVTSGSLSKYKPGVLGVVTVKNFIHCVGSAIIISFFIF